ncbi:MAG: DUF308 domain-containing protein [Pseudomonadota bacterium]
MTTSYTIRLILVTAAIALLGALVAFINPFGRQVDTDVEALSFALEQFLGGTFAIVGVLTVIIGRYQPQPLKWQLVVVGVLATLVGLLVLFNPAMTLRVIALLIPLKLISSGLVRLSIGRRQMPSKAGLWILGAGAVSLIAGLLALLHFAGLGPVAITTLLAIDLIATSVMMTALTFRDRPKKQQA